MRSKFWKLITPSVVLDFEKKSSIVLRIFGVKTILIFFLNRKKKSFLSVVTTSECNEDKKWFVGRLSIVFRIIFNF